MEINLVSFDCLNSTINILSNKWHIQNLEIAENYVCGIASEKQKTIKQFSFNELFSIEIFLNAGFDQATHSNE